MLLIPSSSLSKIILGTFWMKTVRETYLNSTLPLVTASLVLPLIAVVFASIPFSTPKFNWSKMLNKVGRLWSYSQVIMILMWGLGLFFSLIILVPLFDVHKGFGLLLAAGFVGGHGTAAAL